MAAGIAEVVAASWSCRAKVHALMVSAMLVVLLLLSLSATPSQCSGGLMDDERLLHSTGMWHRKQRKRVTFETACYYTHEMDLPHGCQYSVSETEAWKNVGQRSMQGTVLRDFYNKMNGPFWRTQDNWLQGDCCWDAWYGVTCDEHGEVIYLELVDNNISGVLPDSIGNLVSLLKLDLSTSADQFLGHVNVNVNRVQGIMPSLARISRLEEIEVSGNEITELPEDLYLNAHSLRLISASRNQLTELPRYLERYTELHTLELGRNQIAGALPKDIGYLTALRYFRLEYNHLEGDMPVTVSGMARLLVYDVSHNPRLTGEMAEDVIVNWAEVEWISILNTSTGGYIGALCLDVPLCWKFMFDTHKDLTWATAADVPDVVKYTLELARKIANQTTTTTTTARR